MNRDEIFSKYGKNYRHTADHIGDCEGLQQLLFDICTENGIIEWASYFSTGVSVKVIPKSDVPIDNIIGIYKRYSFNISVLIKTILSRNDITDVPKLFNTTSRHGFITPTSWELYPTSPDDIPVSNTATFLLVIPIAGMFPILYELLEGKHIKKRYPNHQFIDQRKASYEEFVQKMNIKSARKLPISGHNS